MKKYKCGACNFKTFVSPEKFVRHNAEEHGSDVSFMFDQPVPDEWLESLND